MPSKKILPIRLECPMYERLLGEGTACVFHLGHKCGPQTCIIEVDFKRWKGE